MLDSSNAKNGNFEYEPTPDHPKTLKKALKRRAISRNLGVSVTKV